ncbi:MAG: thiamine ABC transporter substrate-binding protein [Bdellovibrionaceae bacterium]|nr:thiamine ABC transporter substrate-binding protein [Pseudobdellovibrionaceae bacterium]
MEYLRRMFLPIAGFGIIVLGLFFAFRFVEKTSDTQTQNLYVLSYPNFIKEWGPGPEIAKKFEAKYGIKVRWVEASNAGMIIEYLASNNEYPIDAVLGLDILSLDKAKKTIAWKQVPVNEVKFIKDIADIHPTNEFIPFDWSPMTFIYKRKEELPPKKLQDLTQENYVNSLGLQDPASSSTGMYFLIWILSVMGEEKGFEYLEQLKPSIRVISPSWSAGYSLFQNDQVPYVFSYFTSPLYHHIEEKNFNYQPIYFDEPHIYALEYAGVPSTCTHCSLAQKFVLFLLEPENQKWIMRKNFMLPTVTGVKDKTEFDFPQSIELIPPQAFKDLLDKKESLLEKWRELQL